MEYVREFYNDRRICNHAYHVLAQTISDLTPLLHIFPPTILTQLVDNTESGEIIYSKKQRPFQHLLYINTTFVSVFFLFNFVLFKKETSSNKVFGFPDFKVMTYYERQLSKIIIVI